MFRLVRIALGLFSIWLMSAGEVRAQGWGWEGWGGWTNTPEGALAQGMGHFYKGAGIFNERTAIADSINANTMMQWNDYLFAANNEAARRYVARRRENSANNRAQNEKIVSRIRDNPTARDIEMGDALNAAINQLTDPRISSAALRMATTPIDASVIQDIVFRNASEGVTIVLSQIRAVTKWPSALDLPRFADQKKDFETIVDRAIKEDEEGEVKSDTLKAAYDLVKVVRAKLAAEPLDGAKARDDASRFIKTLAGLVRLLERPDTTDAFNQLRQVKTTPLSNLIAFMEIYNLRFGQATTPRQRQIYRDLFVQIDAVRQQAVRGGPFNDSSAVLANPNPVFEFFSNLFR